MPGNNTILQERDYVLLRELSHLKFLDREQVKALVGFTSTTRVNSRLLKLVNQRLLRRFYMAIGPGTKKSIYVLTSSGATLIGEPYKRLKYSSALIVAADLNLTHQLELNNIYVQLRQSGALRNWKTFEQALGPALRLIPDAYFELSDDDAPVFLEVDLGTETSKVWRRKIAEYVSFAASGHFKQQFQKPRFRVAVVTTTDKRLKTLQQASLKITTKLFWFTTFNSINRFGFVPAEWLRPSVSEPQPFLRGAQCATASTATESQPANRDTANSAAAPTT